MLVKKKNPIEIVKLPPGVEAVSDNIPVALSRKSMAKFNRKRKKKTA